MMGFSALTIGSLSVKKCASATAVYTQAVRWKRKPIWLPPAPTKLFKIPKRPEIPTDESLEIRRLYNHYKTAIKSMRRYIINMSIANQPKLSKDVETNVDEDYQKCLDINNQWNQMIALDREHRLTQERMKLKATAEQRIRRTIEEKEKLEKMAAEQIRKAKALAKHIITCENIDIEIEKALKHRASHDYAIDVHGKIYKDIFTKPFNQSTAEEHV